MTRSVLGLAGIAVAAALGVGALQPTMASSFRAVKARDDVYMLPPPEQLKASTLGYRSAVADILWATLLVEYGRHWADKRSFPDLEKYVDAILALEPGYANLYRFVDTLLVFRPIRGTEDDARKARAYLERGLRERPADKDIWMRYGQFVGFLAPSFLSSEQERQQWRLDGSEALVRAMELGGNVDRALSASSLLSRSGRRSAALDYLERAMPSPTIRRRWPRSKLASSDSSANPSTLPSPPRSARCASGVTRGHVSWTAAGAPSCRSSHAASSSS